MVAQHKDRTVKDLTTAHLTCRDWRHAWSPESYTKEGGFVFRSAICERCGSRRQEYLNTDGYIEGRSYIYVEGYQLMGDNRPTSPDIRKEVLRRARML